MIQVIVHMVIDAIAQRPIRAIAQIIAHIVTHIMTIPMTWRPLK
jgi:hypothetical protein